MQDADKVAVLVSRLFGGKCPKDDHQFLGDYCRENCWPDFNPFLSVADAFLCVERLAKSLNEIEPGKGDFMFDGLGYRCCEDESDGSHGKWRAWFVKEDPERHDTFATADTPARAIAEACWLAVKGE